MTQQFRAWAAWCRECEAYVDAISRPRCGDFYCPDCGEVCYTVPDAREPEALLQDAVRILGFFPAVEDGGHPDVQDFLDRVQAREAQR